MDKKNNGNEFVQLEPGKEPVAKSFKGERKFFGLPNKAYTLYLEGLGNDGEKSIVSIQLITPLARKLTGFISKVSGLLNGDTLTIGDGQEINDLIDITQELFQISSTEIDKLTFDGLFHLIGFAAEISVSPSFSKK
ncbi:MAG: hypothetical protein Q4D53_03985 [Leptotrichiaceae bacterium]|nr:hypothetical protein [Leptotrichiaceae bacterium]